MKIIYEDNHLLVVDKKPNQPTQEDASGDYDLLREAKDYLIKEYNKPGEAYLGLVQRLDRPVGGVMVFAKTSKAAGRLNKQFNDRSIKTEYISVVEGYIEPAILEDKLSKNRKTNTSYVDKKNGKYAKLIIDNSTYIAEHNFSKLSINLITGRSHQVRVQLSSRNLPIWGDARYNPNAKPGQQIALWSTTLTLNHPTLKKEIVFKSSPPQEFPYNL